MKTQRLIVGISGASGAPLAMELLRELQAREDMELHVICSHWGLQTLELEAGLTHAGLKRLCHRLYPNDGLGAPPASGSFATLGMVIVPCSMKTLAGIVTGYSDSLLLRAADVTLKEHRPLVLVPRECPLGTVHLRNLCAASELGAALVPPVPAYYEHPQTIQDVNVQVVSRVLRLLGLSGPRREWAGL